MDDEDDIYYEYVSNGGCTRCDAMDGRLSRGNPMPRPHDACTCQIVKRDYGIGTDDTCDESLMSYTFISSSGVHHDNAGDDDDEFDIVWRFQIRCPDGETIEAEVVTSTTYGEFYADSDGETEDLYAEALELVEELAASECQTCPEPPAIV